jgi:hypothetical protein
MTEERQHQSLVISTKKGVPVYAKNPSVPNPDDIRRRKPVRFGDDKRGFIVDGGNGDVVGVGGMNFYEFEEVDNAKFVKMFLAGIKQAAGLSKAGLSVFELVYTFIQENPNTDRVELSFYGASQQIKGLLERTYQRGLRELLDREFLFRSPVDGVFFVNIRYMFNGDRLAFVKGYRRKGSGNSAQRELPLLPEEPPALPATEDTPKK